MALTLETAARNAACNAIVDLIDGETDAGVLKFETSGDVEVATITFAATAFGAAATGVATAAATTDDSSATGGTVAQFSIYAGGGDTKILEGTVTATGGGGDITMSSLAVTAGDTVSLDSLTITMPAS
jgi:hypothetical protein